MEVVQPRCAGLDVSKRDVKVCVRIQGRGSRPTRATVTTWGSTTRQILALRDSAMSRICVGQAAGRSHMRMLLAVQCSIRWT
jgi:hypothetical protein